MISLKDVFFLDNRYLLIRKGTYDMHRGRLTGEWIEMLPPLAPVVTITASLTAFTATKTTPSDAQSYTVQASNLFGNLSIVAPSGYELSRDGFAYSDSLSLQSTGGVIGTATIYVRLKAGDIGTYEGNIVHTATGYSEVIAVTGEVEESVDAINYGFLYNGYATQEQSGGVWLISDAMSAAGWDVPSDTDFTTLETYLGGVSVEGGKLKETGLTYWNIPNTGATNEVGFNGRGGGFRDCVDGTFCDVGLDGYLWSSTEYDATRAWVRYMSSDSGGVIRFSYNKRDGYSVRLVRPATAAEQLLPDGELSGVYYTGNDGKVYRCTKIGTQVWIADNLAETKWSDGNWIAGYDGGTYTPITNANWTALTTAALCAYDDDTDNI